jgi:hypothetical protein
VSGARFVANYLLFSWNVGTFDSQFTIQLGALAKATKLHNRLSFRESLPEEDRLTIHLLRMWEDNGLLYYNALFYNCNSVAEAVFEMQKEAFDSKRKR